MTYFALSFPESLKSSSVSSNPAHQREEEPEILTAVLYYFKLNTLSFCFQGQGTNWVSNGETASLDIKLEHCLHAFLLVDVAEY